MNDDSEGSDLQQTILDELNSSPPEFKEAFAYLTSKDISTACHEFSECARRGVLVGTSLCLQAYCLNEMQKYRDAIESCRAGRKAGVGILGLWYYFDVIVTALNNVDDLQGALAAVNESIGFFKQHNSQRDLLVHLARKQNILKQMASHFSRDDSKQVAAKECIIGAIQSICESLSISTERWEDLEDELSALSRIAGRVGVKSTDLAFLSNMPHIWFIVEKHFSSLSLAHYATTENYNRAVDLFMQGNRLKACEFYEKAFAECPEETSHDLAFKGLIAYFYGVNLLRLFDIENLPSLTNVGPRTLDAIKKIKALWAFTVRVYKPLDPNFIQEFDHQMPPGLSEAVRNIGEDRIMAHQIYQ